MSGKNRWVKVRIYEFENVFGFDYLKLLWRIRIDKISLDTLSENEKILWDFYTEFGHIPKTFYNNNGKLVCR
jgi:hypothetical protein